MVLWVSENQKQMIENQDEVARMISSRIKRKQSDIRNNGRQINFEEVPNEQCSF